MGVQRAWERDPDYRDVPLQKAERRDGVLILTGVDGWSMMVPDQGYDPPAQTVVRFFGDVGHPIRGVILLPPGDAPFVCYYRTPDEEARRRQTALDATHREDAAKLQRERGARDARWAALPPEFRARLVRFTAGNPNFRRDYEEYELFVCEQAMVIVEALRAKGVATGYDVRAFAQLDWAAQEAFVDAALGRVVTGEPTRPGEDAPTASRLSADHSGNTLGMACRLAHWMVVNPSMVVKEHGALVALVGCAEYGCTHPDTTG